MMKSGISPASLCFWISLIAVCFCWGCIRDENGFDGDEIRIRVDRRTVKSSHTPCEMDFDFGEWFPKAVGSGPVEPGALRMEGKDPETGLYRSVDFRLSEHFRYGHAGKIDWLIPEPAMTEFRLRFRKGRRSTGGPPDDIHAVGVGDEIMFNNGEPHAIAAMSGNLLADWNGDGRTDVLTINDWSDRFGWPYDGIFFRPGILHDNGGIRTSGFFRIRYLPENSGVGELRFLHARYNWVYPTDWDEDGRLDLLYVSIDGDDPTEAMPANRDLFPSSAFFTFLRNTGRRDFGGLPILEEKAHYPAAAVTRGAYVPAVAAEDLDGDGRKDLIGIRTSVDGAMRTATVHFFRNRSADNEGIPVVAEPVTLMTVSGGPVNGGSNAFAVSFGDVNGDGRIDIIGNDDYAPRPAPLWFENRGAAPPVFSAPRFFPPLPEDRRGYRWVKWKDHEGLLGNESGRLYSRGAGIGGFGLDSAGRVTEIGGPLIGGAQEKPEWVDWDDDGDMDLVAGEAFGRIHFYENIGTRGKPRFRTPVWIRAAGEEIRIFRNGVFGGTHWHGAMGYPSVAAVDWDRDGLFDLVVPNETNRVFWFRNVGKKGNPEFGPSQQILPDGFVDSPRRREQTRRLCLKSGVANLPYPYEEDIPFFWRTRLAIADYTGDGLEDIVALNGVKRLILYERYRDDSRLGLRSGKAVCWENGNPIREPHFFKLRSVDWDEDGLVDLVATQNLFGPDQRSLLFLKNVGSRSMPVFRYPRAIRFWGEVIRYSSHGLQPSFVDWDGDGSLDFVGCNESGLFLLFRNAVLTGSKPKADVIGSRGNQDEDEKFQNE